jgi:hypothetical protein
MLYITSNDTQRTSNRHTRMTYIQNTHDAPFHSSVMFAGPPSSVDSPFDVGFQRLKGLLKHPTSEPIDRLSS